MDRVDRLGLGVAALTFAWTVVAAVVSGGDAVPAVVVLLGCATAVVAGRWGASMGPAFVPGAVAATALVMALLSPVGTFSDAPLDGPLGYANAKSAFFVQAAVASVMVASVVRGRGARAGAVVLGVVFGLVPVTSGSVTAALTLLLVPVVLLLGLADRRARPAIAGAAAAFVIVLGGTIVLSATEPPAPAFRGEVQALEPVRVELWRDAFTLMTEQPILGVGPGRFAETSPTARADVDLGRAHHEFLQQGAETGVPGLLLLVSLFVWAFVRIWRGSGPASTRALAAASVAALGVAASFDFVLRFPLLPITVGLLVGSSSRGRRRREEPPTARGRPVRVAHVATVDSTLRFLLLPQLRRLRDEGYEVVAVSAPGEWVPGLEATGIRHVPWTRVTRSWNPVADVRAFAELIGIFRRERFDVVHTHTPKPGIMGRVAARLTGIPCVVNTVHGLYATPEDPLAKRMVVLGVEGMAARLSDLELYQSEEDLSWARRRGVVPDGRGVLLGNGADLEHFDPSAVTPERVAALRRELGLERDAIVVGTVGRLVEEKGYRELFAAADRVCQERSDVRFLVVGEIDEDKADAIRRGEIEAAGKHVAFSGWRQDVRDLLAAMDVFVLPSWREGLPRSAIEAAAMGKPMVLTDVRGCREVVRDGVEGILVPPRDPAALAEAIATLVESPELRSEYGAAARARAVALFDERLVEERIVGAYDEVLAGKGLRTPTRVGVR